MPVGSGLSQDVRLAVRALFASRLVTGIAWLTLVLAIGATTAVFTLVNSLLLRSLAVDNPDRLFSVTSDYAIGYGFKAGAGWNHAMWEAFNERAGAFGGALAWHGRRMTVGRAAESESVVGLYTNGEFFSTLGVRAIHGRVFNNSDAQPGGGAADLVTVISHRFWQRRFGGAPDILGTPLLIDGVPVTVVGITPPAFLGLEIGRAFDVALPITTEQVIRGRDAEVFKPRSFLLLVMLRLKDGQTVGEATRTLQALQRDIVPAQAPGFATEPFTLVPAAGGASLPGNPQETYKRPLLTMLAGVSLILIIACVNIANLLLARAAARRRDFSVRLALGASRWRMARPLMIESLLLAMMGALGGLVLAAWGAHGIAALTSVAVDLSLDWRVAGFTATITLATMLLFGLAPAIRATQVAPAEALKPGARGATDSGPGRLSSALVIVQITMALVLVIAAGLLVRTFNGLARLPLGFDASRLVVVNVDCSRVEGDVARRLLLFDRLVGAVAAVPGVERAAGSVWTPLSGEGALIGMDVPDGAQGTKTVNVLANFVTKDWFSAYGTPRKAGRDFTAEDSATAPGRVMVNEAFARRFVPAGDPVGATTARGQTIIGVVGDAVFRSSQRFPGVTSLALREPVSPTIYAPLAQLAQWDRPIPTTIRISVRARSGPPAALAPRVGAALAAVDPNLAVTFRRLSDDVETSLAHERTMAVLATVFGALSLLLATLGLYGVTAYAVGRRRAEIGVRMALGARRADVVRLILGQALSMVIPGTLLGLMIASAVMRVLSGMLFGVTAFDPPTFVGLSLAFAGLGILAAFIPAYRASREDPVAALR